MTTHPLADRLVPIADDPTLHELGPSGGVGISPCGPRAPWSILQRSHLSRSSRRPFCAAGPCACCV